MNDPIISLQMHVDELKSREVIHKQTIDDLQRKCDAALEHIHKFDQVVRNIGSYVGATCAGIDVPHANGKGSDTEQAIILKIDCLKAELAALKSQASEPVCWARFVGEYPYGNYDLVGVLPWENEWYTVPLYLAPPQAEALVADFKRRAIEAAKNEFDFVEAIDSLPLIEGEQG